MSDPLPLSRKLIPEVMTHNKESYNGLYIVVLVNNVDLIAE
jgi:hypothetical protein